MGFAAVLSLSLLLIQGSSQPLSKKQARKFFQLAFSQAIRLRSQGQFDKAAIALSRALFISRESGLNYDQSKCLIRLGFINWNLGFVMEAQAYFSEARTYFIKANDNRSEEFCSICLDIIRLYNQGKENREEKLYHRSLERLEQAAYLGRKTGFLDFELKCLRQQGLTYWDMRRLDLYLDRNEKALEISKRINHIIEKSRCLNNIGIYYQTSSDYSRAAPYFERALSLVRTVNDKATEAECLSNLGILYRDVGNSSRALFYLSSALELDQKTKDLRSVSIDLENIGTIFLRRGIDHQNRQDLLQALESFQNCLLLRGMEKTDQYIKFTALNNIGIILNELRNYRDARRYFELAMRTITGRKYILEKCQVLSNIAASFLYEENTEDALRYYLASYNLGASNLSDNLVIESCLGLGQCYERKSEKSSALAYYRKAIEAFERVRNKMTPESFMIGYARNKVNAYQRAIRLLANEYVPQQNNHVLLEKIYNLVERAKAQAFLEKINKLYVNPADVDYENISRMKQTISMKISEISSLLKRPEIPGTEKIILNNELEQEEEKYSQLFSGKVSASYDNRKNLREEIYNMDEVRGKLLNSKIAILEYFLGDNESYLIFITAKSARLYLLPGRADIARSIRAYIKIISDGKNDIGSGFRAAERIGAELIPLGENEELRNLKTLIIIPDGILHYLPFETLRIRSGKDPEYLIEKYSISYVPSASVLYALRNNKTPRIWKKDLLAIGNPRYEIGKSSVHTLQREETFIDQYYEQRPRFTPLFYSKNEVMNVARYFSRDKVELLVGKMAKEELIKKLALKDFRIIHFACHGFLDEKNSLRSALVLSLNAPQEDDGFLQMREIYALTLSADLVVLSACQTGYGNLESTEGLMGLVRSFFFAGARSVVAPLWPINDRMSAFFMREFYSYIAKGNDAREALRLAKLRMLNSSRKHPFYWASFLIQGDPSST